MATKASRISLADEAALREHAFTYPQVTEDFPWGHRAIKVNKKVFLMLVADESGLSISVKLPESNEAALTLPFAEPTGYGLGKSGWVSCQFKPGERAPVDLLRKWVDESFRAVAPARVLEALQAEGANDAAAAKPKPRGGKRTADRAGTAARGKSKRAVSARRG